MNISNLRIRKAKTLINDRAIIDLLELQQLGWVPGFITSIDLRILWQCDKSQVSRRMHAINRLGVLELWVVLGSGGGYWLKEHIDSKTTESIQLPVRTLRHETEKPLTPSQRWEMLRQRLSSIQAS